MAREDWITSPDPITVIAARHGIAPSTLSAKAGRAGWPPRGSGADHPLRRSMRISQAKWHRIREDWISSLDTPKVIAARHGIHHRTLLNRAAKHDWPERGSMVDDPVTIACLLYADLTTELRASLSSLREGGETPAAAGQRAPLIRAHRRSLIALLDARKPIGQSANPTAPDTVPALDLDAARTDILTRLSRMDGKQD